MIGFVRFTAATEDGACLSGMPLVVAGLLAVKMRQMAG